MDLPKGWPMMVMDLKQLVGDVRVDHILNPSPHHALEDAILTKNAHEWFLRRG